MPYGKGKDNELRFKMLDDRNEALEFNGKGLPPDFLMAKLALTSPHKNYYNKQVNEHSEKYYLRGQTQFNFFKADLWNDEYGQFNEQFER